MTGQQPRARGGVRWNGLCHVRLLYAGIATATLSALVVMTAARTDPQLGASLFWPWLLTGLQVLAMRSAGTGPWWGWLLGAAVQLAWIVYAVLTGQLGFIAGCAISAAIQTRNFLEASGIRHVVVVERLRGWCS